jgi:hypothetical protein
MQSEWRMHISRWFLLILIQVLVLQQVRIGEGWLRYGEVLIYPLFILFFPMRIHNALLILLAFVTGLAVDLFYDTVGVHAGASVFSAFVRPLTLRMVEPRVGYDARQPLTRRQLGLRWFLLYTALFMALHIFVLQVLQVFTLYHFGEILLRSALTWVLSMSILLVQDLIFNPRS